MAPKRDYRFAVSQNGPLFLPGDLTDDEAKQAVEAYDAYIARLTQTWQESSSLQRKQIEAQIEDAKKARENALAIAQMQDATSRYGLTPAATSDWPSCGRTSGSSTPRTRSTCSGTASTWRRRTPSTAERPT